MGSRCRVYVLRIYIIMLYAFVEIQSFEWIVKSKPLVFGEDVQLACYGGACQPNTIKKWIGGPSYKLLCYVGYTADSSKYEIEVNDTDTEFGLMIKHISVEDIYCRYTCACGLNQYTNTLDLEGVEFIYPPVVKYNMSAIKGEKYQVEIQMTAYPLPKCYITYQKNVTVMDITSTPMSIAYAGHQLRLYNVTINHTIDMEHYSCNGTLFLKCDVEHRIYTLINQSIDICTEKNDTNDTIRMQLIYTLVPICLTIGFVSVCIYIYRRDLLKKIKCSKPETVELHTSNEVNGVHSTGSNGSKMEGSSNNLINRHEKPAIEINTEDSALKDEESTESNSSEIEGSSIDLIAKFKEQKCRKTLVNKLCFK